MALIPVTGFGDCCLTITATACNISSPVQVLGTGTKWAFDSSGANNWQSIAAGNSCGTNTAIKCDGTLWVWGRSNLGFVFGVGDGTTLTRSSPVQILGGGTTWKSVTADTNLVAIKTDGTLWSVGWNCSGQLGNASTVNTSSPVQTIAGGTTWCQASTYRANVAAIKKDGTLWVWGYSGFTPGGTIGDGTTTAKSSPVQIFGGGTTWCQVSLGSAVSGTAGAAVKTDGTLWTWGKNTGGVLGTGNTLAVSSPVQTIAGGTTWKSVSSLRKRMVATKTDGTLWTWGYGGRGLGNNTTNTVSSPIQIAGTTWRNIAQDGYSDTSFAVKTDGTLWGWGLGNDFGNGGNLGDGTNCDRSSPVQIGSSTTWADVQGGDYTTLAVKTDGTLWVWGGNRLGGAGIGDTLFYKCDIVDLGTQLVTKDYLIDTYPNLVPAMQQPGLWIWGSGSCGSFGNGVIASASTPVQTIGGANWKQISVGSFMAGAIKNDGTLWMWGDNSQGFSIGTLGIGTTLDISSPVQIAGGGTWKQISAAGRVSAGIKTDGTLWTWGWPDNSTGNCASLGNGTTLCASTPVQTVAGGSNWVQVSTSSYMTAAIKQDGTLWTWGASRYGNLGNNNGSTLAAVSSPIQTIAQGTNWKQASVFGGGGVAAIKQDGSLWTWGCNSVGQLGNGIVIKQAGGNMSSPVQTLAAGTWRCDNTATNNFSNTSGNSTNMAIDSTGRLWIIGTGLGIAQNGGLGNGNTLAISSPIQTIMGGTTWKQISGGYINAGIDTNGRLWTWGSGINGGLGTGNTIIVSSPVQVIGAATTWKQVDQYSTSGNFAVAAAVKTDGTLWTWGSELGGYSYGMLGTGTALICRSSPGQTIAGGTIWKQVSVACNHMAAIKTDGTLWTWGSNYCGQLGTNCLTTICVDPIVGASCPIATVVTPNCWKFDATTGANNFREMSTNNSTTTPVAHAAITCDGRLWLWGCQCVGNFGAGAYGGRSSSPVQTIGAATTWKQVVIEGSNTFAIKTDGTLWCWGICLSFAGAYSTCSPSQTVQGGTTWKQVSFSQSVFAVKTDGTLWGWGPGGSGILQCASSCSPIQIGSATNWCQVSTNTSSAAGIKTDGTLWTWGCNTLGQVGNGATTGAASGVSSPVQTIATGTTWKSVSVGSGVMAAIKTDGTLWVWGCGQCGRLGNGLTVNWCSPGQTIAGGTTWKMVCTGADGQMFAVKTDGTGWAWGQTSAAGTCANFLLDPNWDGTVSGKCSPIQMISPGGLGWAQVTSGMGIQCTVTGCGQLFTWGTNSSGQLGTWTHTDDRSSPTQTIAGGTTWCLVRATSSSTLGIKTDGTLWTLGLGSGGYYTSSPVQVLGGGTTWRSVDKSGFAVKTDGTLWALRNYGNLTCKCQLPLLPTQVGTSTSWCEVNNSIGVKSDGSLWVWGCNTSLKALLGIGITADVIGHVSSPVQTITGGNNWKQVCSCCTQVAAIKTDGTLWLWGCNNCGQLGDGTTINKSSPVQTALGSNNWKSISTGSTTMLALKTDGTIWGWGLASSGQLGNGLTTTTCVPIQISGTNWKQVSTSGSLSAAIAELGDF